MDVTHLNGPYDWCPLPWIVADDQPSSCGCVHSKCQTPSFPCYPPRDINKLCDNGGLFPARHNINQVSIGSQSGIKLEYPIQKDSTSFLPTVLLFRVSGYGQCIKILLARLRTIGNTQRATRSLQLPSVLFDDISKDWTILKDLKFKKSSTYMVDVHPRLQK